MTSKKKVLYIEDDVGSQRLVQRVLENHKYDVLLANEGLAGIDMARQHDPGLILMDINLPGMNGREITTRLRSINSFHGVPIIAITANNSPGHRERALAAGCDGFIAKPIDVVSFPREIESFLDGYRERLDDEEKLAHLELHAHELVTRLESKIEELEEANRRLRELDRMKSDFMAVISHELRTPLTLVEGYTHLLDDRVRANDRCDEEGGWQPLVKGLRTGVQRIAEVVNEVISVSRITAGTLQLEIGPLQVAELLERSVTEVAEAAQARDVALSIDCAGNLPVIEGDGKQLFVALENLLGNAIKYTPDGGRVQVSARAVGDAVDIAVSDTGIGIPVEQQRQIFDHFHVVESTDNHSTSKSAFQGGGLGLGLAITQGIVRAHDGRIWVESDGRDPEKLPGSTFHLLLPVKQPAKGKRSSSDGTAS